MLIHSISMHDFRQFKGTQTLSFSCDKEKNVTVLLGDNTFGKTTILQAFNWCLYGIAVFPKESNPDFLLNLETASENAGLNKKCEVVVTIVLSHKNIEYTIERIRVYVDRSYDNWTALPDQLTITYKEGGLTKQIKAGEEKNIINSILPQSLSGYFFFDTERVADISSRKDLSEAVRGLLGLAAVGNARKHLGSRSQRLSVIGQWNASLDSTGDERAKQALSTIDEQTQKKARLEEQIANYEEELKKLEQQKERISEILRDNQDTANLQREKQQLEKELDAEKSDLQEAGKAFLGFFGNGAVTYFLLPSMDKAEQRLTDANLDDRGIHDMTEDSIRDIINRGRCICGAPIVKGNDAYQHIMEEMRYLPPAHIGTAIQNYRSLLANERRNISQFYPTIAQNFKSITKSRNTISNKMERIAAIDQSIFGKENMKSYEEDLNHIKANIRRITESRDKCVRDIGVCDSTIESAQKVCDSLVAASAKNKKIIEYMAYAEAICAWIDETYIAKEHETKDKLQAKVNDIFNRMYHGNRRVQIDNQYHVTLLSQLNGKEVVTGESEGLKRVKNFAFIAGLVDLAKEKASFGKTEADSVTWENEAYPLVMDAPFSNADETHIKNISAVLPEVANQVIMFVMEKDWQYAKTVMEIRVGKYCGLKKISESHTIIEEDE